MENHHSEGDRPPGFWSSRWALGWLVLAAVAAFFLLAEHGAHVLGALPYLLLLACPLMHVFMHRGHGHHHHHHHHDPGTPPGGAAPGTRDADPGRGTGAAPDQRGAP
ncbi:MAG: DUF2933 domain-containing protein [Rhodoferax sp.]